jgi:hypothetical protein
MSDNPTYRALEPNRGKFWLTMLKDSGCPSLRRIAFCLLLAATAVVVMCKETTAQCVVYSVVVDGEVRSVAKEQTVIVRVHTNNGKKSFEARTTPERGAFHVNVPFDTFVSVHLFGAHNCSRRPTAVEVILLADGSTKQTVKLSIEHDFTLDSKTAEWHVKVPVTLVASAQ